MKKITVLDIMAMKERREKIVMLTAYDYPSARIVDECGVDIILVGDSLGTVVNGLPNTLAVTVDELIYHSKAVARARKNCLVVADMPFLSYQVSVEDAKRNCGRVIKESGAEVVKMEGGQAIEETIEAVVDMGIPVMGHIGLTPQSIHKMGGYKVQGRDKRKARELVADARAVERAGAFAVVLEGIPLELAREITRILKIPTIGIGAGIHCDGQVLVLHDMLGYYEDFKPTFVKRYANIRETISKAVGSYISEVRTKKFPTEEHSYFKKPRQKPGK
jgi:3-methyl-2-oxobutanoate hydroxymethyltransferase